MTGRCRNAGPPSRLKAARLQIVVLRGKTRDGNQVGCLIAGCWTLIGHLTALVGRILQESPRPGDHPFSAPPNAVRGMGHVGGVVSP